MTIGMFGVFGGENHVCQGWVRVEQERRFGARHWRTALMCVKEHGVEEIGLSNLSKWLQQERGTGQVPTSYQELVLPRIPA